MGLGGFSGIGSCVWGAFEEVGEGWSVCRWWSRVMVFYLVNRREGGNRGGVLTFLLVFIINWFVDWVSVFGPGRLRVGFVLDLGNNKWSMCFIVK